MSYVLTRPAGPGWYDTSKVGHVGAGIRRYWNGSQWSVPVPSPAIATLYASVQDVATDEEGICHDPWRVWMVDNGEIVCYHRRRPLVEGVGDVASAARGSGARFNIGKPPLELIPLAVIANAPVSGSAESLPDPIAALGLLGAWQMSGRLDTMTLYATAACLGCPWAEAARVFEYGRAKYAAWNWAKGMPWSVALGSAARHLIAMRDGEANDPESNLPHVGHVMCNLVMLIWYAENYREGDDRFKGTT